MTKYNLLDLSHRILDKSPCTFGTVDMTPKVTFTEGESQGTHFITSCVDNLHANLCTHIDFPGHLADMGGRFAHTIGDYPVDRFVGPVAILDFSAKLAPIRRYFDPSGNLAIRPAEGGRMLEMLRALGRLEIGTADLMDALDRLNATDLRGVLVYSGLSAYWRHQSFDAWNYLYFFNPFFSVEACHRIKDLGLSFVGIDALQLENPVINFRGDELPIVLHDPCRRFIAEALALNERHPNHRILLGNDILIYENMKIPAEATNRVVQFSGAPLNFQLQGVNDNAMVRPIAMMEEICQ